MNSPMTQIEVKDILDKVARKSKARRVLTSGHSYSVLSLLASVATGISVYFMADSTVSIAVQILISVGVVGGVLSQIDSWRLQRRLDAAIELLLQIEDERG
jgi:hypothetical protein